MDMLEKHKVLEKNSILMLVFIVIVVAVGGLVEAVPLFRIETTIEKVKGMRPYTPLELAGQNIYIRENCSVCHSQQIRPLRDEVERYGHYSLAAESMYDHPFLWGSKRTGPDLARVGGKYSDDWHVAHLSAPREMVPSSIMPSYSFLKRQGVDLTRIKENLKALRTVGVPYTEEMIVNAYKDAITQADPGVDASGLTARYGGKVNVRNFDGGSEMVSEMDALVAYLQALGTFADIKNYNPDLNDAPAPAKEAPK
ncbi:MAG: cytochrome-c oxidase, cbb3-type subunit II [Alphaproteobacteria bacterium]|nr:MAG: cytochrome-c oxidase, cbb3-type subunit II [Alphaproteobacteria bacterium]